jgi:hypothetical protein
MVCEGFESPENLPAGEDATADDHALFADGTTTLTGHDPADPERVRDFANGYSCYEIRFAITEDRQLATCGGREVAQLCDIADSRDPEVLTTIPHPHGQQPAPATSSPGAFSHVGMVSNDGGVLVVGDEGGLAQAPAYDAHAEAAGRSACGPLRTCGSTTSAT